MIGDEQVAAFLDFVEIAACQLFLERLDDPARHQRVLDVRFRGVDVAVGLDRREIEVMGIVEHHLLGERRRCRDSERDQQADQVSHC